MTVQPNLSNISNPTNTQNITPNQTYQSNSPSYIIQHTSPDSLSLQSTSYSQINHPLNQLYITSLNTKGLNDDTKFKCLLKFIEIKNYSIFGISETKIKDLSKKYLSNNNYQIHWSSTNSS